MKVGLEVDLDLVLMVELETFRLCDNEALALQGLEQCGTGKR